MMKQVDCFSILIIYNKKEVIGMKLIKLLEGIEYNGVVLDSEISFLTCDSRQVKEGCVFACLNGVNCDGHDYAIKASQLGASAVLVERDMGVASQIIVDNTHAAYAKMCANFYNNPAKKLKFIGVTGTNGKTTVTNILKNILSMENKKVGLIGTIQNEIGDIIIKADKTTPNHLEYQKLLKDMVDGGCEYVVMEVSSHALEQHRIADTKFEIGVFTNLSQDHLDYHETMENYYLAKKKLFDVSRAAVICVDDEYGKRLAHEVSCSTITFSAGGCVSDYSASDISINADGVKYKLTGENSSEQICFSTPGMFSVYNSMAAAIVGFLLGLNAENVAENIASCNPVKGRSENIPTHRDFYVICDYAHSPDGLKNILDSINSYSKGRVVTLFGCGGDRDKTKRPIMGEVAAKNSDFLIVTSDNPRTEDPDQIIEDIIVGVEKEVKPYVKITDRKEAIKYALENAQKNDIILLAGKGHEDYQIVGKKKINMDERTIVEEILNDLDKSGI